MVRFPAVTVCNQNPIKKDRLEKDILNEINLKLQQYLEKEQDNKKGTQSFNSFKAVLDHMRKLIVYAYIKTFAVPIQLRKHVCFELFRSGGGGGSR